jgi:hypothetical protein
MSSRSVAMLARVTSSPTRSQISSRSSGSLLSGVNETGVLAYSRSASRPLIAFDTTWAYEYPDGPTLRRALVAPAGIAALVGPEREEEVKDAIVAGLAPHRTADGRYRLQNEFRSLIARA